MARTRIIAQAQNADNLTTEGYITPDNISTDLVQYRLSGDNEIFGLGTIYTSYKWIIKGDGVNSKVVGSYPPTDTDPVWQSLGAGYNWPQGNVSEIFTYLNAGGPNVKYTKFTYNVKRYDTTSFINPNTRGQGIEWDRNLQNEYTIDVEIYWGKYTMYNVVTLGGEASNLFFDISELSGETNAAARNLSFGSYGTQQFKQYPEINLDTRKITKLPRYFLDGSANGHKLCDHAWIVETDDFATTVSAPAPQENTEEASGTKISELSSTSSLQDNDLLVISRDEGSDGSFDTSYNVSLSNLAAKMGGATVEYLSSPGTVFSYNSVGPVSSPTSPLLHNTYQTYDIPSSIPSSAQGIIVRFHTRADEGKVEVFAKTGSWSERIVCRSDGRNNSDDSASDVNTFIIPYSSAIDVKIDWTGGSNEEAYFYIDGYIGGGAAKMINDMPATSNGWSSGWVDTDGTTSVADGADLNFQHNLGTTDVIIQVYAAIDASGTNSINVSQHEISQTDIPRSDYGCQILPSLNSVQVVLASHGLNIPDIGATYNVSSESYSTYNYIKVVAVKI